MTSETIINNFMNFGCLMDALNYHIRGIRHLDKRFPTLLAPFNITPKVFTCYRIICLNPGAKINYDQLSEPFRSWSLSTEGCKQYVKNSYCSRETMLVYQAKITGFNLLELTDEIIRSFDNFLSSLSSDFLTKCPEWSHDDINETIKLYGHIKNFRDRPESMLNNEQEVISLQVDDYVLFDEIKE